MTDGMLQVQLLVPSLKTDAAITATLSHPGVFTVEIKSDVKVAETSSVQAVTIKYGMSVKENSVHGCQILMISRISSNTVMSCKRQMLNALYIRCRAG